ncbi:hypothetical protein [Pseudorhodoferax sp.]|uniref:hypothetical protein n=1 Tax=Pseudorhodoferax sp. TaxID=1993553 RepID=UPI002DD64299|nr:hypothetical protein [Pseudorhodoferax sp.]
MVAVESSRRLFALRLADGSAWVFSQHSGLPVRVGELLLGDVDIAGFRLFAYGGGFCRAYREAGPFSHEAVLGPGDVMQTSMGGTSCRRREEDVDRSVLP